MPDLLRIPRGPTLLVGAILLVVSWAGECPAEWGQNWGAMVWGESFSSVPDVDRAVTEFALYPNFPNPFNPRTVIRYALPESAPVTLRVYSVDGRTVRTLMVSSSQPAGYHERVWDGADDSGQAAATGVYFCTMDAGQTRQTIRMVLIR